MSDALDQAFAITHLQNFNAISNLQRRMLLIQSIKGGCDRGDLAPGCSSSCEPVAPIASSYFYNCSQGDGTKLEQGPQSHPISDVKP